MSQAFYRKWRPRLWEQVIGQEHVIQTLRNAVKSGRVGHAYLFAGPRGTGKTTTARLLAKAVNCLDEDLTQRPCDACAHCTAVNEGRFLDLIEIDAASNTSVDDVRDLRDKINFSPSQGRFKVYIIDEVHMLSTAAFNALLKTLEEPPPHAIFILATTEVHKIPATVLSRCQRHEFRRVPVAEIVRFLTLKAAEENLQVDEDAMLLIARQATGSMRDGISLLDQLSSTGQRVTLAGAQTVLGTAASEQVIGLVEAILKRDPAAGMLGIQSALDNGTDARQFARQVVDYLRGLMLVRMNNAALVDVTAEMRAQMAAQAARFETGRLLEVIRLFNEAAVDTRSAWQPGLGLELALAESVEERAVVVQTVTAQPAAQPAAATQPVSQPAAQRRSAPAEPPWDEAAPAPDLLMRSNAPAGAPPRKVDRDAAPAPTPTPAREQPAPAAASATGEVSLAQIHDNWKRIRSAVRQRSSLVEATINSVRTYTIKDGVLILGFQTEIIKSKMETGENLDMVQQALRAVLGVDLPVRCVVVGNKNSIEDEVVETPGDGLVNTALDLGGIITDQTKLSGKGS